MMKRKLRYVGHVIRVSSEHLLQLALEGRIEVRRGRGRPKRSWTDDIKQWTHYRTNGEIKRKAESKEEWRVMVANFRTEEGTEYIKEMTLRSQIVFKLQKVTLYRQIFSAAHNHF
ncbi:endonuclease-reverse transcriptase [Elysia marginata]|uniref:Endonuclease-reverse transcriptase n=1 Tax=Elysia marginata TaxID=1093978 RepID=A0AAV4EZT4_9GAST|nr:endonuclease-reverse transcriptase [Elysia marginata]